SEQRATGRGFVGFAPARSGPWALRRDLRVLCARRARRARHRDARRGLWRDRAVTHRPFALVALAALVLLVGTRVAHATEADTVDATNPEPHRLLTGFAAQTRPAGMAEGNIGVLTLPGSEVCGSEGCSKGDVVFALEGWEMYRATRRWAFGAGGVV